MSLLNENMNKWRGERCQLLGTKDSKLGEWCNANNNEPLLRVKNSLGALHTFSFNPYHNLGDSHIHIFQMKKQALSNISKVTKQICQNWDLNPSLIWMKFWVFVCLFVLAEPCGLWDLSPTRDWTWARTVKVPSPNYWTTREFPGFGVFFSLFVSSVKGTTPALLANHKEINYYA